MLERVVLAGLISLFKPTLECFSVVFVQWENDGMYKLNFSS